MTLSAEKALERPGRWRAFLRQAVDTLIDDPEPDGLTKFVAPANSGYSGCLLYEVFPWRIFYQLASPNRVIIVAVTPHPLQM